MNYVSFIDWRVQRLILAGGLATGGGVVVKLVDVDDVSADLVSVPNVTLCSVDAEMSSMVRFAAIP